MKKSAVFSCLVFLLTAKLVSANHHEVYFTDPDNILTIGNNCEYFEDRTGEMEIEDIIRRSDEFAKVQTDVPNFHVSSSTFWIKLDITNKTKADFLLLVISHPVLDHITYFQVHDGQAKDIRERGEEFPFSQRDYYDPSYIFRLDINENETQTIYLRIRSRDNIQVPMQIGTGEKIFERTKTKDTASGLYLGIMFVMLFYNVFLYASTTDRSYLHYVFYLITVILTQAGILGYAYQYFWPNWPWLAVHSSFIFPPLVGIAGMNFMRVFLHTKENSTWYDKGFYIFSFLYIIAVAISFFGDYTLSFHMIEFCAGGASIMMLYMATVMVRRGYRPAKFFLIAWIVFLFGVMVYTLKDFGVLPYNNFTYYLMPIGSAIEVILLSFALADRINILKEEKEASQKAALEASLENERITREQNKMLEEKVEERTAALKITNTELNATLNHLKDTQAQLVDAEKMASLGQLTAGIAHEINNPINFVSANVEPLRLDIQDIFTLIDEYSEITPDSDIAGKLKSIEKFKRQIDLNYVRNEIVSLLTGIDDGARRTAEIVKGLRNFSRLDESELKDVDLNEGLESTLILLRNSIPDNVTVDVEYGDLPRVECFSGKINQVFMNIINNGIQAIKEKKSPNKEYLKIRTFHEGDDVLISIRDTGKGMSEEVKAKIFEPFFTTKEVGEGTGLGLSIVFKIITTHSGKIEVNSIPGKGTEFIVSLPVKAKIMEETV